MVYEVSLWIMMNAIGDAKIPIKVRVISFDPIYRSKMIKIKQNKWRKDDTYYQWPKWNKHKQAKVPTDSTYKYTDLYKRMRCTHSWIRR